MPVKPFLSKLNTLSVASSGGSDANKFSLYLKIREIRQINAVLRKMSLLPEKQKVAWFDENGEMLQDSFDEMINDSNSLFENLVLDDETLELSEKIVVSIRDAIYLFSSLTSESDTIS